LILWILGCGVPEACDEMCRRAADAQEACLADRGLTWEAAGFADRDDFLGHCDTWAWEEAQIGDAGKTCATRRDRLDGTCASYEALTW
jgi:hypothetical protein